MPHPCETLLNLIKYHMAGKCKGTVGSRLIIFPDSGYIQTQRGLLRAPTCKLHGA